MASDVGTITAAAVTGIMGGGFMLGIYNLTRARIESKKAPAERDSIIVEGAEKAVVSLGAALEAAEKQLTEVRTELDEERKLGRMRESKFYYLARRLDDISDALRSVRSECEHIAPVIEMVKAAQAEAEKPITKELPSGE